MFGKRFCPKCKSKNIKKNIQASLALGTPQEWICNKCRFQSLEFPIKEEKQNGM